MVFIMRCVYMHLNNRVTVGFLPEGDFLNAMQMRNLITTIELGDLRNLFPPGTFILDTVDLSAIFEGNRLFYK